ncbi:MAG: methylase [Acidobacteria bacterium]|nr:MAG: methylase [Acidobacteriota bacterium]
MKADVYTNGPYLERNPSWHVEDSAWKAETILKLLRRNQLEPRTFCEVGCGAGEILRQLQNNLSKDCTFIGYDISPQALDLAQLRANERLQFKLGDITTDHTIFVDIILIIDLLEHLENYYDFLRTTKRKSRYHVLHIPLDLSVQSVLRSGRLLTARQRVGHIHYFTKETALQALSDVGYHVIDYIYTGSGVDRKAPSIKNQIAKLPRQILFALQSDLAVRLLGGYSLMVVTE